jgi:hypothetical protein
MIDRNTSGTTAKQMTATISRLAGNRMRLVNGSILGEDSVLERCNCRLA